VTSVASDSVNYVTLSEDGSVLFATDATVTGNLTVNTAGTTAIISPGNLTINPSNPGSVNNVNIGASTRGSAAFTSLTANSAVTLTANTTSSGTSSGTLVVTGGVGVSGTVHAGAFNGPLTGTLQTAAQPNITSTGSLTIPGLTVDTTTLVVDTVNDRVGIGTANPDTRLHIVTSNANPFNTVDIQLTLQQSGGNAGSGTQINFVQGDGTNWIRSLVTGSNSASGSALAFGTAATGVVGSERVRINSSGDVGIGTDNPNAKLHVFNRVDGGTAPYTPEIRIEHQDINAIGTQGTDGGVLSFYNIQQNNTGWSADKRWGQIDFYPSQPTAGTAQLGARIFAAADGAIGSTNTASYIAFSTTSGTSLSQRLKIDSQGRFLFNTNDVSYTQNDNTPIVGGKTDNKLFVNGSIQLINNDDAIVIGRDTGSFFKDDEIGFGWGSGWHMTDGTYLRMRNPASKVLYLPTAPIHTYQHRNNSGSVSYVSGSKGAAGAAFNMFQIDGLGGSNGFFTCEIFFSHSGGGMHGSWCRYKVSINAYTEQQAIEFTQANWGGGNNFSFTRNTNDRMTVRWNGASSFSSSFSMYAIITANRTARFTNIGMDGFTVS
jgi:hypothetical protein